jgi:hypothetical protein
MGQSPTFVVGALQLVVGGRVPDFCGGALPPRGVAGSRVCGGQGAVAGSLVSVPWLVVGALPPGVSGRVPGSLCTVTAYSFGIMNLTEFSLLCIFF